LLQTNLLDDKTARFMRAVTALFSDYYGAGVGIPLQDDVSGRLTHVGGMARLSGGVITQNINIRYPITADREPMKRALQAALEKAGLRVTRVNDSKPCYIPKDTPVIAALTDVCNRVLGTHAEPYVMGGGTYARHLPCAVGYGPGIPGENADAFGIGHGGGHQPDEYVTFHKLRKAFLVYVQAIPIMDALV